MGCLRSPSSFLPVETPEEGSSGCDSGDPAKVSWRGSESPLALLPRYLGHRLERQQQEHWEREGRTGEKGAEGKSPVLAPKRSCQPPITGSKAELSCGGLHGSSDLALPKSRRCVSLSKILYLSDP